MPTRGYTLIGWLVWQIASRVAKRKIAANRNKLVAIAVVAGVLVAGLAAAREAGE